jgi:hypothetical protein
LADAAGYLFHGCAIRKWAAKMSASDGYSFILENFSKCGK